MAQPFDCLCGKPTCRGRIGGARDMTNKQLEGLWINGHIRELLEEKAAGEAKLAQNGSADSTPDRDARSDTTAFALEDALKHAHKVVEAARNALQSYMETTTPKQNGVQVPGGNGHVPNGNALDISPAPGNGENAQATMAPGMPRRGPTSRELSGEMGGDTIVV